MPYTNIHTYYTYAILWHSASSNIVGDIGKMVVYLFVKLKNFMIMSTDNISIAKIKIKTSQHSNKQKVKPDRGCLL